MKTAQIIARAGLAASTVAVGLGVLLAPAANAATPPKQIQKGDSGHGVWCVQHAVNDYYRTYYNTTHNVIAEDAQFGTSTADWVAWYQGKHGRPANSIVDRKTGHYVIIDDGYYGNYCKGYVPH